MHISIAKIVKINYRDTFSTSEPILIESKTAYRANALPYFVNSITHVENSQIREHNIDNPIKTIENPIVPFNASP